NHDAPEVSYYICNNGYTDQKCNILEQDAARQSILCNMVDYKPDHLWRHQFHQSDEYKHDDAHDITFPFPLEKPPKLSKNLHPLHPPHASFSLNSTIYDGK